jgi:hypothetical protein
MEWKIAEQLCDVLKVSSHTGTNFDQQMFSFSSLFQLKLSLHRLLMHSLLHQIFKHATLFFSRSTPNLATIIPVMDVIDKQLTNDSLNHTWFDVSICASLGIAKRTLNCYYNMTDWSEVYRIAMGE